MNKILVILFLIFPASIFADSSPVIYQKKLDKGFMIVQTQDDISLYYNEKKIHSEKNTFGIECTDWGFSDLIKEKAYSKEEGILMNTLNNLSATERVNHSVYFKSMQERYPRGFNTLVKRVCWNIFLSGIKYLGRDWYRIYFPQYDMSKEYYFNVRTRKLVLGEYFRNLGKYEFGRSGLYVLNTYGLFDSASIYLIKDDGTYIQQYSELRPEWRSDQYYLNSFELLVNRKIKLILTNENGGVKEKIISVK